MKRNIPSQHCAAYAWNIGVGLFGMVAGRATGRQQAGVSGLYP